MSHTPSLRRRLLVAFAGAMLLLGAMGAAARAESYGELGQPFGGPGTGNGKFQFPPETHAHAFGVDPTDNSVYVGDEPTEGEYRIQKLSATGQFLASVSFKPAHPIGLEGIAVDPEKERVYALAVTLRGEAASIDPAKRAAETLYAFKTKQSGETLDSAVSGATKEDEEGVLANSTTLETESEVQGHALLEPSGIAVDPTTHDVIIMGQEDQGEKAKVSQLRVVLQRVSENGVPVSRYVDETNCFGGEGSAECKEGGAGQPTSPVVSQTGRVYVESVDQIWEIPSDFTSTQPPKLFIQFNSFAEHKTGPVQELVEFPGEPAAVAGGGLSIAPEGTSEGTLYAYAHIFQEKAGSLGSPYPGALAFKYSEKAGAVEGTELGWTGGQSEATGGGKCTINFHESPSLAAGKEHDLFVFDPDPETKKHKAEPHVDEFGPGGSGCPVASASPPDATVKGQAVTEVPAGTKVTLSSTVEQANALSVEWNFGDGDTETESGYEYQAVFTNEVSKATTAAAALTVKALKKAPVVTESPADKAPGLVAKEAPAACLTCTRVSRSGGASCAVPGGVFQSTTSSRLGFAGGPYSKPRIARASRASASRMRVRALVACAPDSIREIAEAVVCMRLASCCWEMPSAALRMMTSRARASNGARRSCSARISMSSSDAWMSSATGVPIGLWSLWCFGWRGICGVPRAMLAFL